MKNIAYISMGSNIGERDSNLKDACTLLNKNRVDVVAVSSVYETDPVGYTNQGKFLNIVVKVKTELLPEQLLEKCMNIENELGRIRDIRWGPRIIDLDILLYNNEKMDTENLVIPHPRMHERAFVLVPLLEVAPNAQLPDDATPLNQVLEEIPDKEGVRLWK